MNNFICIGRVSGSARCFHQGEGARSSVSRNIVDTFNQQSCSAWHPPLEINSSGAGLQVAAECGHLMIQTQVLASHKTIAGISRIITRGNNIKMRRLETRIHNMYSTVYTWRRIVDSVCMTWEISVFFTETLNIGPLMHAEKVEFTA